MFDVADIQNLVSSNQLLAAGVGTTAFGGFMYVARSVPGAIWSGLKRTFTTTFTVTTRYSQYEEIVRCMGRYTIPWATRNYAPSHQYERGLAPGYGRGIARYKGVYVSYERKRQEGQNERQSEVLDISFLTRDLCIVEAFMKEAALFEDINSVKVRISASDYFGSTLTKRKRDLATVFVPSSVKGRLVERMRAFVDGEETYLRRGIPWKFCAVLHGPPGTGKTSLVHALASEFNLNINYITSLKNIDTLVTECRENDLLVLEDVDALANKLSREKDDDDNTPSSTGEDNPVLHRLLNALDGFCTPHGLKVMMTTNHPEKLDPALLRPGRTDLMLEVGPIAGDDLRAMFDAFYGDSASLMLDGFDIHPHTGSHLQQIFTTHTAGEARDILVDHADVIELEFNHNACKVAA